MKELHILNLGAGVQSTFLYLAFMRGMFDLPRLDAAIFADTGDEPGAEARELELPDTPGSVYAHLDWLKSLGGACSCIRCSYCGGSGNLWITASGEVYMHRVDDLGDLETCDECRGTGVTETCEECYEANEREFGGE